MRTLKLLLLIGVLTSSLSVFAEQGPNVASQSNIPAQHLTADQILQQLVNPPKYPSPTCPGGEMVCPSQRNCCSVPTTGGYSCTVLPNGVCCPSGKLSCGPGYQCSADSSICCLASDKHCP